MGDPALNMKNPNVLWPAAGVVATIVAAWIYSRGGNGGGGGSSSNEAPVTTIPSSQLLSEVKNVNDNAAHVTETLLQTQQGTEHDLLAGGFQYASHLADVRGTVINNTVNDATHQLAIIESAQDQRYQTLTGAHVAEYATEVNGITQNYGDRLRALVGVDISGNTSVASEFQSIGQSKASEIGSEAKQAVGEADASSRAAIGFQQMIGGIFSKAISAFSGGFGSLAAGNVRPQNEGDLPALGGWGNTVANVPPIHTPPFRWPWTPRIVDPYGTGPGEPYQPGGAAT